MAETKKRVYRFGGKTAEGDGSMRELLGGKGANLAEMSKLGMPVPAGFTITTESAVLSTMLSAEAILRSLRQRLPRPLQLQRS